MEWVNSETYKVRARRVKRQRENLHVTNKRRILMTNLPVQKMLDVVGSIYGMTPHICIWIVQSSLDN